MLVQGFKVRIVFGGYHRPLEGFLAKKNAVSGLDILARNVFSWNILVYKYVSHFSLLGCKACIRLLFYAVVKLSS